MTPALFFLYIAASLLVGYIGRQRVIGFWGFFIGSLLLTPGLGLFVFLVTGRRAAD